MLEFQGLVLGADSAYKGNTITNNGGGPSTDVVGPGVEIGANYCGSNTTCP